MIIWNEIRPAGNANFLWKSLASSLDASRLIAGISSSAGRLYLSSDYGATWTETQPAGAVNRYWDCVASSQNGQYLLAGAYDNRIYRSINYGATWTETQPAGAANKYWAVACMSATGQYAIVGVYPGRLYRSTDYGATWVEIQPAGAINKNWFKAAVSDNGVKWIVAPYGGRLYLSSDYGATWTETQPAGAVDKNWGGVASNSSGSQLLAGVGGLGRLYRSQNYGATWTETQPAGAVDKNWWNAASSSDGSKLCVAANLGRVYTSIDAGNSWAETNPYEGTAGDRVWYVLTSSGDGTTLVIGINNGRLYRSWVSEVPPGLTYTVKTGCVAASLADNCQRKLARKSNGDLWCVYYRYDGTRNQIYVSYSTDMGGTWTEEQVSYATGTYSQVQPAIAIDSQDNVHVVWEGPGKGTYPTKSCIQYRKKTTSWQTQEELTNIDYNQYDVSIAIDSQDNIHVSWSGAGTGTYPAYQQVQYCKRTTSWQAQESLTNIAVNQLNSSIAIDSLNNIHVTWPGAGWPGIGTNYTNIQYNKRTSGGWQGREAVTDVAVSQSNSCIAIDSQDNVHITWTGIGSGNNPTIPNIYYRKRTTSWQAQELVSDKTVTQQYPSIAVDSLDNIQVTWQGVGWGLLGSYANVIFRKKTTSWQVPGWLTDLAFTHTNPIFIWAPHPTFYSVIKSNRTKTGCALVWMEASIVKFYRSDDLTWDSGIPPEITVQPVDITTYKGQLASFTISATGTPSPTYQWYKDDIILPGEMSSTLAFYCDFKDAGVYKCIATNVVGEDISDPATLTVVSNPWRYALLRLQSDFDRS